ncbi:phosphotransferase [Thermopolyspora sp. NPDC052614]|uniref:phosphotransferase n=1 Tax=Thermopolyspora sp. NPDC052614 TaxID=3155682 RepID=UPI0034144822
MSRTVFTKSYRSPRSARQAAANHAWLEEHTPLRQPRLLAVQARRLDFEHVDGRHVIVEDLVTVATLLGEAHAIAWLGGLHRARLDTSYLLPDGHAIPAFVGPRRSALSRHHRAGTLCGEDLAIAVGLLQTDPDEPAAFYKDSNPRNILITPTGPVIVDPDDLTLAPFGYDLAKLVVTLAMTHGPIHGETISSALAAYNQAVTSNAAKVGCVTPSRLLGHAHLHHLLTSPYLGRGGYRYPWPQVRPNLDDIT